MGRFGGGWELSSCPAAPPRRRRLQRQAAGGCGPSHDDAQGVMAPPAAGSSCAQAAWQFALRLHLVLFTPRLFLSQGPLRQRKSLCAQLPIAECGQGVCFVTATHSCHPRRWAPLLRAPRQLCSWMPGVPKLAADHVCCAQACLKRRALLLWAAASARRAAGSTICEGAAHVCQPP